MRACNRLKNGPLRLTARGSSVARREPGHEPRSTPHPNLTRQEANTYIAEYVAGLEGYTYLEGDAAR